MQFEKIANRCYRATFVTELLGTQKQIDWASDIRATKVPAMIDELEQMAIRRGKTLDDMLAVADFGISVGQALDFVAEKASAKFWIDNRAAGTIQLLRNAASEINA